MFIVFSRDIKLVLQTHEISLCRINSHDLHRIITHSLILVIVYACVLPWESHFDRSINALYIMPVCYPGSLTLTGALMHCILCLCATLGALH